ncbi:hypothetical protein A7Q09_07775 [Methylacidiphilum sp. Yel]|nr:helix-turn-helix domain-containing protein [Methylacidiphilum sp. Yel]TFE67892.1 hypothetical protein A7Q09_07775 [Methylacidiphilum sp. Yel]
MIVAHKIALDPNHKLGTYFAKAAETARFAYNWALAQWQRQYLASVEHLILHGAKALGFLGSRLASREFSLTPLTYPCVFYS